MSLYAVIIAGGRGKRFWPLSRQRRPKYLLRLPGEKYTLLQQSVKRLQGLVQNKDIIVVTNRLQTQEVKRQLWQIDKKNILSEPASRNTAPAIGLAAAAITKKDPQAIIMVLPADQLIKEKYNSEFRKALKAAAGTVKAKDIFVTIGIKPTSPATGFGYIKIGRRLKANIFQADKFIEKPNLDKTKIFIKDKNYLWNSGIFIWRACSILKEIEKYLPKLAKGLNSIKSAINTSGFNSCLNRCYKDFPDISIDYGVMEKSKKVYAIKSAIQWHDIGSWKNLYDVIKSDARGNIIIGPHIGLDAENSIIIGKRGHLIATSGADNIIVIHTPDATLVCKREKSESVKKLVEKIEKTEGFKKFL